MSYFPATNFVSIDNSSSTLLTDTSVFTGIGEDVSQYGSVIVAVKTDQNGSFSIQFSNDGTNWDSVIPRHYRTAQTETPHRFTITRKYCRVVFTNDSGADQTYFRLQTTFGDKVDLGTSTDADIPQDFDSLLVRPTSFDYEVALGRRQGYELWNKFGHITDLDTGTETIWSHEGLFVPIVSAETLDIVSTSVADVNTTGTGAWSVIIYGVDENWVAQTEVVLLNGTTPVTTVGSWLGVNRMSLYLSGSGQQNAGTISATASTEGTVQVEIPVGLGTSQHAIFFVQAGHTALIDWLYISLTKNSGGSQPTLITKMWVTSGVSGSKYEVFRDYMNGDTENHSQLTPKLPFVVGEKSIVEFQGTTDQNNTEVSLRFALTEVRSRNT